MCQTEEGRACRVGGGGGGGGAGSSFVLTAVSSPPELSPSPGLHLPCHPAWLRGLAGRLPSCDVGHVGSLLAPLFIFPGGSDLQGRDYPHRLLAGRYRGVPWGLPSCPPSDSW